MTIAIRDEVVGDATAIDAVTRAAFRDALHASHTEQLIVAALREAGALAVSRVATDGDAVVGHVAVSAVTIDGVTGSGWYGLGPLSVVPERQRQGIGSALVRAAIEALRDRGALGCVVLGDPAYYARFGYEPAAPLVLADVPPEYFQARVVSGAKPAGMVRYHAAFEATA